MKKYLPFILFFISFPSFGEIFTGNVAFTAHSGHSRTMHFEYNIDLSNPDKITGTVEISNHPTCKGLHEIELGSLKGNVISLRTKLKDGNLCGRIILVGELEGNKIIGKVPWGQNQLVVELRKK
jgi:hypothetical protein